MPDNRSNVFQTIAQWAVGFLEDFAAALKGFLKKAGPVQGLVGAIFLLALVTGFLATARACAGTDEEAVATTTTAAVVADTTTTTTTTTTSTTTTTTTTSTTTTTTTTLPPTTTTAAPLRPRPVPVAPTTTTTTTTTTVPPTTTTTIAGQLVTFDFQGAWTAATMIDTIPSGNITGLVSFESSSWTATLPDGTSQFSFKMYRYRNPTNEGVETPTSDYATSYASSAVNAVCRDDGVGIEGDGNILGYHRIVTCEPLGPGAVSIPITFETPPPPE